MIFCFISSCNGNAAGVLNSNWGCRLTLTEISLIICSHISWWHDDLKLQITFVIRTGVVLKLKSPPLLPYCTDINQSPLLRIQRLDTCILSTHFNSISRALELQRLGCTEAGVLCCIPSINTRDNVKLTLKKVPSTCWTWTQKYSGVRKFGLPSKINCIKWVWA